MASLLQILQIDPKSINIHENVEEMEIEENFNSDYLDSLINHDSSNYSSVQFSDRPGFWLENTRPELESDRPGLEECDRPGLDLEESDRPGLEENDRPGLEENDRPGLEENDILRLEENDRPGLEEKDRPGLAGRRYGVECDRPKVKGHRPGVDCCRPGVQGDGPRVHVVRSWVQGDRSKAVCDKARAPGDSKLFKASNKENIPLSSDHSTYIQENNRTFKTVSLKTNNGLNSKPEIVSCEFCDKTFSSKANMKRHVKSVHGVNEMREAVEKYFCSHCIKYFGQKTHLTKHLASSSCLKNLSHFCPYCAKGFQDYMKLDNHVLKNNCPMKYKCDQCGKYFVSNLALIEHDCQL